MVKLTDILDFLNLTAPPHMAESYDNVGLLIGEKEKEIRKVLVTLDTDEIVAIDAREKQADLVLSHHPLIFRPLGRITGEDAVSRTVLSLIKDDIALFSMHTNFDSVKCGLGDLFLDKIAETQNRVPIEGDGENGIGRIADVKGELVFSKLLDRIKTEFHIKSLRYIGPENKQIRKIAVVNGGGADYIYEAKKLGADCFVSGDMKYHQARFAYENDLALVEVPHYQAEIIFCGYVKQLLENRFGSELEVLVTDKNTDIWKQLDELVIDTET